MVGKALPDFDLEDDLGNRVTPATLRGGWTVIYAYPKDNTPGCTTEACDFRDHWSRVQALGAQVYGLSRDSVKSHQGFIAKHSLPFRLLSDPEASLLKALGAFGRKVMYGREMEGIIRSTYLVDPKGIVRHAWPKVSVRGHVEEVLEKLKDLM
ncbi:MAG: peroxiredoxin [Acidobacteria bacterium]|nr:peroxiredoxin [Acidobacteriota bacterium]